MKIIEWCIAKTGLALVAVLIMVIGASIIAYELYEKHYLKRDDL